MLSKHKVGGGGGGAFHRPPLQNDLATETNIHTRESTQFLHVVQALKLLNFRESLENNCRTPCHYKIVAMWLYFEVGLQQESCVASFPSGGVFCG